MGDLPFMRFLKCVLTYSSLISDLPLSSDLCPLATELPLFTIHHSLITLLHLRGGGVPYL